MGRTGNSMITFDDANFMVQNEGFVQKVGGVLSGGRCMTKSEIESSLVVDPSSFSTYSSNQLVPYSRINRGLYITPLSPKNVVYNVGSFNVSIQASEEVSITFNDSWLNRVGNSVIIADTTQTITVQTNTEGASRNGTITFSTASQSLVYTVIQAGNPGVAVTLMSVGYNANSTTACNNYPNNTVYLENGTSFFFGRIYSDSSGLNLAPSGWYSDGSNRRFWTGTGWTGETEFCI